MQKESAFIYFIFFCGGGGRRSSCLKESFVPMTIHHNHHTGTILVRMNRESCQPTWGRQDLFHWNASLTTHGKWSTMHWKVQPPHPGWVDWTGRTPGWRWGDERHPNKKTMAWYNVYITKWGDKEKRYVHVCVLLLIWCVFFLTKNTCFCTIDIHIANIICYF